MKGIANYLCRRRFHEHVARQASLSLDGNLESTLDAIRVWAQSTDAGDRAELPELADDSPAWRDVSPTPETRLGQRCKYFERCFVTQARRRAHAGRLVIVNHHLFFADLALRANWPDAQLLPAYEAVIFDEAHQLEDVATDYFGVGVSSLRLMALVRDVRRAVAQGNAPDKLATTNAHVDLRAEQLFEALRRRLGARASAPPSTARRWAGEPEKSAHALDVRARGARRPRSARRAAASSRTTATRRARSSGARGRSATIWRCSSTARRSTIARHVFWAETRGRTVLLHASPVDVSAIFRERLLGEVETAVFTSATLTAGGSFEFVRARARARVGDGGAAGLAVRLRAAGAALRAEAICPSRPTRRSSTRRRRACASWSQITDGRAFLLFTSHRMMQRVHALLAPTLAQPVLLQGDKPKHLLVEEFKRRVGSVLFATASFWEGVDVVGEALSLVVIDKLPFSPPDDPLVAARAGLLEDAGQDPFVHYHVPRAALALAQGFGRLIRHRGDRGVVALLDKRAVDQALRAARARRPAARLSAHAAPRRRALLLGRGRLHCRSSADAPRRPAIDQRIRASSAWSPPRSCSARSPSACSLARARGVDLKKVGSGNIGATNAARALGKKSGVRGAAARHGQGVAADGGGAVAAARPRRWRR